MSCVLCGEPTDKGIAFCEKCENQIIERETTDLLPRREKQKSKIHRRYLFTASVILILAAAGGIITLRSTAVKKQNTPDAVTVDERTGEITPGENGQTEEPPIISISPAAAAPDAPGEQTASGALSPTSVIIDTLDNAESAADIAENEITSPVSEQPTPENDPAEDDRLPYYIEALSSRYEAFQEQNPDMPFDMVVAYTNANVDKGSYVDVEIVENPDDIKLLLNQNFELPSDYEPPDLVTVNNGRQLRSEAAAFLGELISEGRNAGLTFVVSSGYRTQRAQAATFNNLLQTNSREAVERNSARPRHSEHELGLAIDVLQRTGTGPLYYYYFQNTPEYAWLTEHAYEYGFILRYPGEYTHITRFVSEPWHWRYIGVEAATVMKNEGITTLEEYYGKYIAPAVYNDKQES